MIKLAKPGMGNSGLGALALGLWLCSSMVWAMTAANTLIKNQASATFKDETGQQYSVTSNMVETLVQQVAGIDLVRIRLNVPISAVPSTSRISSPTSVTARIVMT
ncbi:MAG: hypothetical protein R3E89_10775 [Thiolinea sp.]